MGLSLRRANNSIKSCASESEGKINREVIEYEGITMSVSFKWKQEDFRKLIECCPSEPVTPYIFKYMPKDGQLLEAGCGSGRFVYYLNSLGYKITGIEINKESVDVLNKVFPSLDISQGDVIKLPFPDSSVSGILSLGVIEHIIEGLDVPIKEMYRVLKKGGYALVIVPSFNYIRRIKYLLGIYHIRTLLTRINLLRRIFGKPFLKSDNAPANLPNGPKIKHWPFLGGFYEYRSTAGGFYEYRLTKQEFEEQLKRVGFSIIESVPTSHIDGIYHEFGKVFVTIKNHTFYPNFLGHLLNDTLSKISFCHNHMHLCVVRK